MAKHDFAGWPDELLSLVGSGGTPRRSVRTVFCPGQKVISPWRRMFSAGVIVGVGFEAAFPADKPALRPAVFGVDRPALVAGQAGILGWDRYQVSVLPGALVLQLGAYSAPVLGQDGPVEAGLQAYIGSWLFGSPFSGPGYLLDFCVLDADNLVVPDQLGGYAVLESGQRFLAFLLYSSEHSLVAQVGFGWPVGPAEAAFHGAVVILLRHEPGPSVPQGGVPLPLGLPLHPLLGLAVLGVVYSRDPEDPTLFVYGGQHVSDPGVNADRLVGRFDVGGFLQC